MPLIVYLFSIVSLLSLDGQRQNHRLKYRYSHRLKERLYRPIISRIITDQYVQQKPNNKAAEVHWFLITWHIACTSLPLLLLMLFLIAMTMPFCDNWGLSMIPWDTFIPISKSWIRNWPIRIHPSVKWLMFAAVPTSPMTFLAFFFWPHFFHNYFFFNCVDIKLTSLNGSLVYRDNGSHGINAKRQKKYSTFLQTVHWIQFIQ